MDCKWQNWDQWGDCSKSCGGGQKTRKWEKAQEAVNGGKVCTGPAQENQECETDACPGKNVKPHTPPHTPQNH